MTYWAERSWAERRNIYHSSVLTPRYHPHISINVVTTRPIISRIKHLPNRELRSLIHFLDSSYQSRNRRLFPKSFCFFYFLVCSNHWWYFNGIIIAGINHHVVSEDMETKFLILCSTTPWTQLCSAMIEPVITRDRHLETFIMSSWRYSPARNVFDCTNVDVYILSLTVNTWLGDKNVTLVDMFRDPCPHLSLVDIVNISVTM